ncbi:unnamed protein product [Ceutorhynchus assimilis]|uniref:Uncharacterized protein n=1 Tax=Ceutorhynchus assimilis TaxID=467358 RepID=A0A9N9MXK8_9CUCU|nr:unnamed protein product [Ceutorhynchus assimilis]
MIVCCISCVALVSQVHVFWVAGLIIHGDKMECDVKPSYMLLGNIINCVDTFVTLILPVILILVMNVIIAKVVFKSHNLDLQEDDRYSSERVRFHHIGSQSSDSTRNSDPEYSSSSRRTKYQDYSLRRKYFYVPDRILKRGC